MRRSSNTEPITIRHALQPKQKHFFLNLCYALCYISPARGHKHPLTSELLPQEEISHALNPDSRMTRLRSPSPAPSARRPQRQRLSQPFILRRASEITRAGSEETSAQAFSKKTQKSLSETLFGFKRAQKL